MTDSRSQPLQTRLERFASNIYFSFLTFSYLCLPPSSLHPPSMEETKTRPWPTLLLALLTAHLCSAADTISANQSLSGSQTIVSARGVFKLGFFQPGNSSNYYIGTWYNNRVTKQTVVWVANREAPVNDPTTSVLRISGGNLVLFNERQVPVWSTNVSSTGSGSVEVTLLDEGNLVLRQGSNSSETYLWQSLDHPTDTWLPGGKISVNKRTRRSQFLTSWKNSEDPAPGLFSLELDPNGSHAYFILWNKTDQYWTSGPWDERTRIFSLVPEMRLNYIYNFSFVDNENESYFTYSLYNNSLISRFIMDISGQIKQLSWLEPAEQWNLFWAQPRQQCEVYAFCGAFGSCNENTLPFCTCLTGFEPRFGGDWNLSDFSGGCRRRATLPCQNPAVGNNAQSDKFLESPNMRLPRNPQSVAAAANIGECEARCASNCSCTAYAFGANGCSVWNGELINLQQLSQGDSNGGTLHLRLAASEFRGSKKKTGLLVGAVAGAVSFLVLSLSVVLFLIVRRRKSSSNKARPVEGSLMAYGYRYLQNATKNFSEKLGGGGFGSVFKGTLPDSSVVAVKKLEGVSQGEKQFRTEVSTIGTIQHVNLIRLRGFCSEGNEKLLVYDYMPNGSLAAHLFFNDEEETRTLNWSARHKIALGTARGLTYLHEKCRDCIIHCDIKPENILLDADLCPKVADFGLAKLVGREFSRVLTTMRGTRGYLAPEWISGVAITAKADVYSYGMMLFELVSGRRNFESSEDGKVSFFPNWAASVVTQGGNLLRLLDPKLNGDADEGELARICKVACWCIQDDETQRPSMGQIVQILDGVSEVNQPPPPRTLQLQLFDDNQEHIVFFTESSSSQSSQARSNVSNSSQEKSNTSAMSS